MDAALPQRPGGLDGVVIGSLPAEIQSVFDRFVTTEYTTIDGRGQPITWPVTPYYQPGEACIDVSTALGTPKKADDAAANPRVALLFSEPTGSGLSGPPMVLVQGIADVDDRDLRANRDRYLRESLEKLPGTALRQPLEVIKRLGVLDWYYERIYVHVRPRRVYVWWGGRSSSPPEVFEASPPEAQPGRREKRDDAAVVQVGGGGGVWDPRIEQLGHLFPTVVLSIVGTDGFPWSVRLPIRVDAARRCIWIEREPAGIALAPGRACLTAHTHVEDPSSKFWQRNFQIRCDLAHRDGGWMLVPRRLVGGFEVSASAAATVARNARKVWRFQRTARGEHARRSARSLHGGLRSGA
jgi:hypothetical protein